MRKKSRALRNRQKIKHFEKLQKKQSERNPMKKVKKNEN